MVSWKLVKDSNPDRAKGKTPEASGMCRIYEFAYWAAGEVVTMPMQEGDKVSVVGNQDVPGMFRVGVGDPLATPESEDPCSEPPHNDLPTSSGVPVATTPLVSKDLYTSFSVLLTKEMKGADLEALMTAIRQLRGVASVAPVRADMPYFIAKEQARREILGQIKDVLKG